MNITSIKTSNISGRVRLPIIMTLAMTAVLAVGCAAIAPTASVDLTVYNELRAAYIEIRPTLLQIEKDENYPQDTRDKITSLRVQIEQHDAIIQDQIRTGQVNQQTINSIIQLMLGIIPLVV